MRRILFILVLPFAAVIAFAGPALAAGVAPGTYTSFTTNPAQAPSGAHISGTPSCTVANDLSINCASFAIGGVGHTDATVSLVGNYTATINCTNHGGNLVESHTSNFSAPTSQTVASTKNGQLFVPNEAVSPFTVPQTCPNSLWTPSIAPGTLVLNSFSETVTFKGFTSPYFSLAQP